LGDKKAFKRSYVNEKGMKILQRMIFYNIEENQFDWDWEVCKDGGEAYQLMWRIHYERKEE